MGPGFIRPSGANGKQLKIPSPGPEVITEENLSEYNNQLASAKLQASFAGQIGKFIEPVLAPLGYDWKIGIALITSFAAREVFVSTISTIYSIGEDMEDTLTIQGKDSTSRRIQKPEKKSFVRL